MKALTLLTVLLLGVAAGALLRDEVRGPCPPTVIATPSQATPGAVTMHELTPVRALSHRDDIRLMVWIGYVIGATISILFVIPR